MPVFFAVCSLRSFCQEILRKKTMENNLKTGKMRKHSEILLERSVDVSVMANTPKTDRNGARCDGGGHNAHSTGIWIPKVKLRRHIRRSLRRSFEMGEKAKRVGGRKYEAGFLSLPRGAVKPTPPPRQPGRGLSIDLEQTPDKRRYERKKKYGNLNQRKDASQKRGPIRSYITQRSCHLTNSVG